MSNQIVIAAAGSGKTTYLVAESLRDRTSRTLITTYTIENLNQIRSYLIEKYGGIPNNVDVMTWFRFLLWECARPYRNFVYNKRIAGMEFISGKSAPYIKRSNINQYYFLNGDRIYTDKLSYFICRCNDESGGLVINRLEQIYNKILIDESQDLAGYDFDVVEMFLKSKINISIVGDCRQATYCTNHSPRNRQFNGQRIINLFRRWEENGICSVKEKTESYRCNQMICDFADKLYPDLPRTISKNEITTGHDGVFVVKTNDVHEYYNKYKPKVLRYDRNAKTLSLPAINFGISKGQTFERVLIFPNEPIKEYLKSGKPEELKPGTRAKFYVAVTRARFSVAFVYDQTPFSDKVKIVELVS
ncbi:MAG: UvrD-helicase domain-containing protein, partial [Candidatus Heimdallarchaeaceae archaeon]